MVGLLRAFWAAFDPGESPEQRGMRLLRAHLTPAQRQQFERCRFVAITRCAQKTMECVSQRLISFQFTHPEHCTQREQRRR
jgi:hypothetical protein